ncbi:MAG: type II toxin-antitoxin system RelE/ParE family toxin [Planctomycetota bacterium]|nr:type II toxin-antitoxin system RelE/ParE family toxin [Planctomycetota bacterium]
MREVIYHPDAQPEAITAAVYFEQRREGLGQRFLEDFDRAIADIRQHPEAWPALEGKYRRRQLRHFPYGIIYRVYPEAVRVLAIMHLHQHPDYWKERI